MIAVDWSWTPLAVSVAVIVIAGLVLRFIRDHGPADPMPWDPDGGGD